MWFIKEYWLHLKLQVEGLFVKKPPNRWRDGSRGNVILIPGLYEKYNFLKNIGDHLNSKGYKIHVLAKLKYNNCTIEIGSNILEEYIKANKLEKVILISHSKGSLIAKYFLDNSKFRNKVIRVITIASALNGSYLAFLAPLFYKDLLPSSNLIKKLKKETVNSSNFLNLYPQTDNHIIPNKNLLIEGAKNIMVDIKGHTLILTSNKTLKIIDKYL